MTFYATQKIILLLIYLVKASLCYTFQPPFTTGVFLWDLLETNLASLNVMAKNWEIYNLTTEPVTRISSCSNYLYAFFGGVGIFPPVGTLERVYAQIPQHNIIYYNFELFAIGPWQSNHYISIQFGTLAPKVWYLSSMLSTYGTSNNCGGTTRLNYASYVVGKVFHTGDTLRITMKYDINETSTPAIGFGLRDFTLSFRNSTASDVEEHYLAVGNQNIAGSTRCMYYQYWDTTTSTCKNCPTGCITCFGPSTSQCHRCAWGYSLVGTSCVPCPTNCGLCSGSNSGQCVTCYDGTTYLDWDKVCRASCTAPTIPQGSGDAKVCVSPCAPNQYMIWNNTCVNSCTSPLFQSVQSGITFCNSPCNQAANEYYYWNGSCLTTCAGYYARNQEGYQFCDACQPGYFRYENGSCLPTCQSPFTQTTIGGSQFCNFPCNFAANEYLYWNNSCLPTCASYYSTTIGGYQFCDACQPGYFRYENGSCLSSCQLPFTQTTVGVSQFCNFPCNYTANEYYNWDSTCSSTCTNYYPSLQNGYLFCDACQPNYFRYQNNSCLPTCEPKFSLNTLGRSEFCNFPCNSNQSLNWNGSCVTNCTLPSLAIVTNVGNICSSPCTNDIDYFYEEENTCKPTCDPPNQATLKFSVKICSPNPENDESQDIAKAVSVMSSSAVLLGLVNSILGGNFELVMIIYMSKMLQYIKYLQINYPPRVQHMLDNLLSISGIFNFPPLPNDDVKDWFPDYPLPAKLGNGDFHSAFVANYFDILMLLIALLSLTSVILILERHSKKNLCLQSLLQEPVIVLKWNFIFIAFCAHYGDVALYTCLQILGFNNDFRTLLSFSTCLIINILGIFIFYKILNVIRTLKQTIQNKTHKNHASLLEDFEKKWKHYKVCFSEYKTESFAQQIYPGVYFIRMILFNIIIGALFRHPLFQTLLLVIMSAFISIYLIWQRPMKKRIQLLEQVTYELIILVFNSCVLCLAILDNTNSGSQDNRARIGDVIIYINLLMNALYLLFESINAFLLIKRMIYNLRRMKFTSKVTPIKPMVKINIETQPPPPPPSQKKQPPTISIDKIQEPSSGQLEVNSNLETRNTPDSEDLATKNLLETKGKSLFAMFGMSNILISQYSSKSELTSEDSMKTLPITPKNLSIFIERKKTKTKSVFLEGQQRTLRPHILRPRHSVESEKVINKID